MSPFEEIIELFFSSIPIWQEIALDITKDLFVLLAVIQILWMAILWMMNRNDPTNLIFDFVQKLMVILFFWAVLENYEVWIPAIYNGLRDVGSVMTNSKLASPSDIMKRGIELSSLVMTAAKHGGFVDKILGSLLSSAVGLTIFILFIRIGIEMVLIMAGGQILLTGGIIVLAFAGSKWTRQYAQNYFTAVISVGLKLLFITLLVGIGEDQIPAWLEILKNVKEETLIEGYLSVLAASFIYYYMCIKIPDLAVSMLTGSINLGFSQDAGRAVKTVTGVAVSGIAASPKVSSGIVKESVGVGSAVFQVLRPSTKNGFRKVGAVAVGAVGASVSKSVGGRVANQIRTLNPSVSKPTNKSKTKPKI